MTDNARDRVRELKRDLEETRQRAEEVRQRLRRLESRKRAKRELGEDPPARKRNGDGDAAGPSKAPKFTDENGWFGR